MGLRRPTLDDVFLQLTGAGAERERRTADRRCRAGRDRPRSVLAGSGAPHAPSLRGAEASVTDSAVVTMRNLRHFWRQPDLLVFSTIQPIMFVVLFVYVFGGAVGLALPPGVTYVDYLLPGIFVQSVTFRATQHGGRPLRGPAQRRDRPLPLDADGALGGPARAHDRRPGAKRPDHRPDDRRRLPGRLPVSRPACIKAVACVALVAAFGFALSWIFAFVSLVVRGAETAQTAGFVLLFPLVFASSVFVPVSSMPDWLQPIAEASPGDADRGRGAHASRSPAAYRIRSPGALAWIVGILARLRPALGLALPEDELAQMARLYAATGDGFARLDEAGEAWTVELLLVWKRRAVPCRRPGRP